MAAKINKQTLSVSGVSEDINEIIEKDVKSSKLEKGLLEKIKIGISISEAENTTELGYSEAHLRDSMIEFARHLLIQDAILVYGGDLRSGGYTEIFSDLAYQYRTKKDKNKFPFKNYFSYPIYLNLTNVHKSEFQKNRVKIELVEPDPEFQSKNQVFFPAVSVETKYIWAKSLTKMREKMISETDNRIFIGGRNYSFLGKYPGVLEEAFIALQSRKPIYLIGTFGGVTQRIINAILNDENVINQEDKFYQDKSYVEFKDYYNSNSHTEKIDINEINEYFKSIKLEDLPKNGLTKEENKRLFNTPHLTDMIFLILKGLSNII